VERKSSNGTIGWKFPLLQIAPHEVSLIIQLAYMYVPNTSAQGLQLYNSIIKATKYEKQLPSIRGGVAEWSRFMNCNGHLVRAKKNCQV
jgi:hypothetical protein